MNTVRAKEAGVSEQWKNRDKERTKLKWLDDDEDVDDIGLSPQFLA